MGLNHRPPDLGAVSSEFLLGSVFSLNSVKPCEQVRQESILNEVRWKEVTFAR